MAINELNDEGVHTNASSFVHSMAMTHLRKPM